MLAAPTEELFFTPAAVPPAPIDDPLPDDEDDLNGWCSFREGLGDGWSDTLPEDTVIVCCVNSRSLVRVMLFWWSNKAAANCDEVPCPPTTELDALAIIPRFDPIMPKSLLIGAYTRLANSSNVLLSLCRDETMSSDRFRSS